MIRYVALFALLLAVGFVAFRYVTRDKFDRTAVVSRPFRTDTLKVVQGDTYRIMAQRYVYHYAGAAVIDVGDVRIAVKGVPHFYGSSFEAVVISTNELPSPKKRDVSYTSTMGFSINTHVINGETQGDYCGVPFTIKDMVLEVDDVRVPMTQGKTVVIVDLESGVLEVVNNLSAPPPVIREVSAKQYGTALREKAESLIPRNATPPRR